jgi:hypothetical protein
MIPTLAAKDSAFLRSLVRVRGHFNVGAQLANLRGLNPYFGTRTLTLVDTKRVVPNTEGGAIDLTLIPSMLVGRTEVVTGGASAAYGSDAIAGVVNVILDTDLEGFKAQVDFSEVSGTGGADQHASFAYGQAIGDNIHLIVGLEHQQQDPIGPCSQNRDWCAESWVVANNAGYAADNGFPNYVVASNAKFATSENGLIAPCLDAACAGRGAFQSFNAAGSDLVAYDPGMWSGGYMNRIFAPDVFSATNVTEAETTRFVTAIEGDLEGGWGWAMRRSTITARAVRSAPSADSIHRPIGRLTLG